jgi:hypothetical protein
MSTKRWMMFVDGENLAIEGQKRLDPWVAQAGNEGPYHRLDTFLWCPLSVKARNPEAVHIDVAHGLAERCYYYTSVQGSDDDRRKVQFALWNLGFEPRVFRKEKGRQSKGVDIALCVDALHHAQRESYDIACVIAGDADFIPLIEELKGWGKRVQLRFFGEVVTDEFKLASDSFFDITKSWTNAWQHYADTKQTSYVYPPNA